MRKINKEITVLLPALFLTGLGIRTTDFIYLPLNIGTGYLVVNILKAGFIFYLFRYLSPPIVRRLSPVVVLIGLFSLLSTFWGVTYSGAHRYMPAVSFYPGPWVLVLVAPLLLQEMFEISDVSARRMLSAVALLCVVIMFLLQPDLPLLLAFIVQVVIVMQACLSVSRRRWHKRFLLLVVGFTLVAAILNRDSLILRYQQLCKQGLSLSLDYERAVQLGFQRYRLYLLKKQAGIWGEVGAIACLLFIAAGIIRHAWKRTMANRAVAAFLLTEIICSVIGNLAFFPFLPMYPVPFLSPGSASTVYFAALGFCFNKVVSKIRTGDFRH